MIKVYNAGINFESLWVLTLGALFQKFIPPRNINLFSILNGMLSAISWGAGDFAGGLAARKLGAYRAVFYSDLLGLLALFIVNAFYREPVPSTSSLVIAGIGGMCGSVGMMTLYYSLAHGQMSIAAPVSALFAAVLPVVVGAITQGLPTVVQFIGFGLALLAMWLISQGEVLSRFHVDRLSDLRLPLLAGLGFGSYFIFMHYATNGTSSLVWPIITSRFTATVMLLVIVLVRRESFSVPRDAWGVVWMNAVFDLGGNFFYLLALRSGRLDISAILSSLYPGATVILAWLLLKERITRPRWAGIFTALVAIALFAV